MSYSIYIDKRSSVVQVEEEAELGKFIAGMVAYSTVKRYQSGWTQWKQYMQSMSNGAEASDPYLLRAKDDRERACRLGLFLKERYEVKGLRDRAATAVVAHIQYHFSIALHPTEIFDSQIIKGVRKACRLSTEEIRIKKMNSNATVKLPVCEDILYIIRDKLFVDNPWSALLLDNRMTYMGAMWGFDVGVRIGEMTAPENGCTDHNIRAGEIVFLLSTPIEENGNTVYRLRGGDKRLAGQMSNNVIMCDVQASSHKMGSLKKAKCIGRRSKEESQWLDDLIEWTIKADLIGTDPLFSRPSEHPPGSRKFLTGKMIRTAVKVAVASAGLPPIFFSGHSLRKAMYTHMRAAGCSIDDRRDRGNYAEGSNVGDQVYDYAGLGHGPLSSNALKGGFKPNVGDCKRYIPADLVPTAK
jgi:integrase